MSTQQASEISVEESKAAEKDMESQIKAAMLSRIGHFEQQSDSLTFEGVRRLLEEDLELETFALDKHKRFVKNCLLQGLNVADVENGCKSSTDCSTRKVGGSGQGVKSKTDVKESGSESEGKMEDSPVLGLLTGQKVVNSDMKETRGIENKVVPSESMIKNAILKRASYFRENSEKVNLVGVRRLLEEDLELEQGYLDLYKKLIAEKLDEVLRSSEVSASASTGKKKSPKTKRSASISSEGSPASSDRDGEDIEEKKIKSYKEITPKRKTHSEGVIKRGRPAKVLNSSESEDIEEEKVKSNKKSTPKGKTHSEGVRKRGRSLKVPNVPRKKLKAAETSSEEDSDVEDTKKDSEDGQAQSSDEKPTKKKEVSHPGFGKRVEHLRSIIKACGMSISPAVYKKAKQAPENKREACLIKELEEILSKEGLSANPSEKEIKEVKRRKERAKELEGIDMSNIVSSSRRRSTTSFVAPKPKAPVQNDGDDSVEDSDNDDDQEDDDNTDDEDGNDDGDNEGSESEGVDEDDDSD